MEPQGIARSHRARPAQLVDTSPDDAFRQRQGLDDELHRQRRRMPAAGDQLLEEGRARDRLVQVPGLRVELAGESLDRKSTRLNSSHLGISYAVFCLKKK